MKTTMKVALAAAVATCAGAACTHSSVQPEHETQRATLPQPRIVIVDTFSGARRALGAYERAHGGGDKNDEHTPQLAHKVAKVFADELVEKIRDLGWPAERASKGGTIPADALVVTGRFVNIDAGSRAGRLVIGLGAGRASVDTQVRVFASGASVLEFKTHADSGELPGAAVTMGAGAAVVGGVTATMAAGNAAVGGVKAYRTTLEALADDSADRAVEYLSKYFADQNWIAPDRVNQPSS